MRTLQSSLLLAAVLLTGVVPAAQACINDSEVIQREREFKSDYLDKKQPAPATDDSPSQEPSTRDLVLSYGATGLGAALLVGATVITVVRRRRVG